MVRQLTGRSYTDSGKYLDRIIQLYTPEFDALKDNVHPILGTKSSHLKGIVQTYVTNGQGLGNGS
jgi:hypothetical protein